MHWSDIHPDRHLWTPAEAQLARGMSQEAYEALYGRGQRRPKGQRILSRGGEVLWESETTSILGTVSEALRAGVDSREMDLRETIWAGEEIDEHLVIEGADLRRADFSRVRILRPLRLRNAQLSGSIWNGAEISSGIFENAELSGASFVSAAMGGCTFDGASLRGANFAWARMWHSSFRRADLSESVWSRAQSEGIGFQDALFAGARLAHWSVDHCSFDRADLRGTHISPGPSCSLEGTLFS